MTTPLLRSAAAARAVTVEEVSNGGDVLLLAPHPDDETLGCGGAIAALSDMGRRVQVIVMTDGARSHPASRSHPAEHLRRLRATEVARAVEILTGGRGPAPVLLGHPDDAAPETEAALDGILPHLSAKTTAVWTTWGGDPHPDHQRTARLAARLIARNPDLDLWSYPIWGRFDPDAPMTDPSAMATFDTQNWQDRKAAAIAAHRSQMTGLIADDPGGFRMSDAHQLHFLTYPEIFLREAQP